MIKVKVNNNNDFIKSFSIKGHSQYDEYGKDIVCASVSSIVITSCNLVLKLKDNSIVIKQDNGLICADVLIEDEIINKVLKNMIEMLEELSKQYKNNIKFI